MTIVKGNYTLWCEECSLKILVILPVDSPYEKWTCPKHGEVTTALIKNEID